MRTLKHTCDNCDNKFKLVYDEDESSDSPIFCPFCAEYIISETQEDDDVDL